MSENERKDKLTLTASDCVFWAAMGYRNFHLRNCQRLNRLTNLRGFESYQHAVNAGYQPCRDCKPTSKHDLPISIPMNTKRRENEMPQEILELCKMMEIRHTYQDFVLSISTPMSDCRSM